LSVDEKNYRVTVNERITVEIVMGSICSQSTDAITNAANSHLAHGAGVAGRISQGGGKVIDQESR